MIQRDIESGYGTITKVAMQDRNLTIQSKAIYAYLCSFAGGKDTAWPTLGRMSYDLSVDRKTIQKHMKLLVEHGYIEIDHSRFKSSKQFAPNYYTILR